MENNYIPKDIEQKWQKNWEGLFVSKEDPKKKKYYCLEMFPYPSGRIHMGHVRNYVIGDVIARYKIMNGYSVIHPIGWDAFGMPAENAAIEKGIHPAKWTYENIASMKAQIKKLGLSYDWSREIATCDEDYYKWNQWLFLKMYEKGIAYKKKSFVNWCPSCETVLANEQVEDGKCWRCDSIVKQKELEQWFFKITDYAEELLSYTDKLPGWPENVLMMQRNWIGKSTGAEIDFPIADTNGKITVFTTRQDTIFGATFMSIAAEHPMVKVLVKGKNTEKDVMKFVDKVMQEDKIERTGEGTEKAGIFTGAYAINPFTKKEIPIWIGNFVLMEYGTGAVMAVPCHDTRDFAFAKKYNLPIQLVIQSPERTLSVDAMTDAYIDDGFLVNSGEFNNLSSSDAKERIADYLEKNGIGKRCINYRLRDWGISRQRYWGTPIPMIYCNQCGIVPVPEKDLPVKLPKDVAFTGKGGSPLLDAKDFLNVKCPKCNGDARRETDTMDTFVDSSWYFLRYTSPKEDNRPFDSEKTKYWMPVDQYIGGIEHAVLHLLYSRFFTKVVRDLGLIKIDEPFTNLLTQGMVCKETLRCPEHGWLFLDDVKDDKCRLCGKGVERGRVEKMSKSKKNVIDPDKLIDAYGADTVRLFSLFAAPPEKDLEWSDQGVDGAWRFLNRVWNLVVKYSDGIKDAKAEIEIAKLNDNEKALYRKTHQTIKKVTEDIERDFHFNTAIAAMMELVNEISGSGEKERVKTEVLKAALEALIILLSPFAPHICDELWSMLGNKGSVINIAWPKYNEDAIKAEEVLIVMQINGKVRGRINLPANTAEEDIKKTALSDERIKEWVAGKEIKKVNVVQNKLVNIVV
ncbi:MAG: leucine--tRNA ligase [Nitrospirae bacterium]|nr:leucine--tRNA ligase [Nitrospirota bacterium]